MAEALLEVQELDEESFFAFFQVFSAPQDIEKNLFKQIGDHFQKIPNLPVIFFAYWAGELSQKPKNIIIDFLARILFNPIIQLAGKPIADHALKIFQSQNRYLPELATVISYYDVYQEVVAHYLEIAQTEPTLDNISRALLLLGAPNKSYLEAKEFYGMSKPLVEALFERNFIFSAENEFIAAVSTGKNINSYSLIEDPDVISEILEFFYSVLTELFKKEGEEKFLLPENANEKILDVFDTAVLFIACKDNEKESFNGRFFQLLYRIIGFISERCPYTGENLLERALRLIIEDLKKDDESRMLDLENEGNISNIIEICMITAHSTITEEDMQNPEFVYTTLFDLDFVDTDKHPGVRTLSAILFYTIAMMSQDTILPLIVQKEASIEKLYIISSFFQQRIGFGEISEEEKELYKEIFESLASDAPEEEQEIPLMHFVFLVSTYPVTGDLMDFPIDLNDLDPESVFGRSISTLFVRMIGNAAKMGIESVITQENTNLVVGLKDTCLGIDCTYAITMIGKINPELCKDCGCEFFGICLQNVKDFMEGSEKDDLEEKSNQMYSELEKVADSLGKFIDLSQFIEPIKELAKDIDENDALTSRFSEIIGLFAEKKENIPLVIDFLYTIYGLGGFSFCIYDCCINLVISLDDGDNSEVLQMECEEGKTIGIDFIEKSAERILYHEEGNIDEDGNFNINPNAIFDLESLDLEAVILVIIKIIFTQDVPPELLAHLLQIMLGRLEGNTDDFLALITCELIAALVLKGIDIVPEEAKGLMAEIAANGIVNTNYLRALIGSALALNPETQELGLGVLRNQIEINKGAIYDQKDDYPKYDLIPNLNEEFVPVNEDQEDQEEEEEE